MNLGYYDKNHISSHQITDTLRETQISNFPKILQILNGYLNRIPFFHLVSNHRHEK